MDGFLRLLTAMLLCISLASCATQQKNESADGESVVEESLDDDFGADDPLNEDAGTETAESDSSLEDEFNEIEGPSAPVAESSDLDQEESDLDAEFDALASEDSANDQVAEDTVNENLAPEENVEAPVANLETEQPEANEQANLDQTVIPEPEIAPQPEAIPEPEIISETESVPPPIIAEEPAAVEETPVESAPQEAPPAESIATVNIQNIRYKANDNGGTVVVESNGVLSYETRLNPATNQFVVEIPNSKLPNRLKRPFNTRDMPGSIGAINAYQNKGSTTTRVVVQLRPGANEPVVQAEGNMLLIIGGASSNMKMASNESSQGTSEQAIPMDNESKILSSSSLEEFLAGNIQFYGKKISLETSDMDIREAIRFISDESGVNLVLSEEVKGTVSIKLRQVPWDQALVVLMKSKKLGYTRAGNVLRIAPITDIKAEEDESLKLAAAKLATLPLKVRMIPISYAKIDDLSTQIKPFLSERGKIIGDNRTSSLVVSDIEENLERVGKLIASIDIPPNQVLIEGKVVEATDSFSKNIGLNWSGTGSEFGTKIGGQGGREVRGRTGFSSTPGFSGSPSFNLNFSLGTLDILGDLTAQLSLFEQQRMAKVLSSPRIVTLHNEPAVIQQTTEIPIVSSTPSAGGAGPVTTVSFKPVSLKLSVTPQITNDGAVIMAVDVNRDFLSGDSIGNTGARPVASRSAKTKVLVRNGQTAVIGGIYQSDQTKTDTKVPWVGDIPILGWLFKSQGKSEDRNELLIFLTPRILGQADSQTIPAELGKEF